MNILMIAFSFALSLSALAQANGPTSLRGKGKVNVQVVYYSWDGIETPYYRRWEVQKFDFKKTKVTLDAFLWGDGKIKGTIEIKAARPCKGDVSIPLVGTDNGRGEFEVYSKDSSVGSLIVSSQKIIFQPSKSFRFNLRKSNGQGCSMTLDGGMSFKRK